MLNFNKTMKDDIESINLPCILSILSSKFGLENINKREEKYICDICNNFSSSTKRGLTSHKRMCKNKN